MLPQSTLSRRDWLRSSIAGGAILGLPASIYQAAYSAETPPSEQIRIGSIGVGNQGKGNLKAFLKQAVAVCEVDSTRLADAAKTLEQAGKKPITTGDYRKLLERKDIDAVVITTPDHWHALQTVQACQAGKDVYCEKPLTLTIDEGKAMVVAARKYSRVVQTGSQQRSSKEFRIACEAVRNGVVGEISEVKVGLPKPNFKGPPVKDAPPPKDLDYEIWLGPAPERPYNEKRVHYLFRFFWDYSGGQQTNFGAHHLDIAQWGLGMDESGPVSVEGTAKFHPEGWYETPDHTEITYKYSNKVVMHCGQGYPQGTTFIGSKGVVYVTRGKVEITIGGAKVDPAKLPPGAVKLEVSGNHHTNWLDCIKSRKKPICDVAIGHRSATVCHLGNIAIRTGKKLTWDPKAETFVGDAEAAKWTSKEYRKPWKLEV
jgi:predicted dehydrogenase